MTLEELALEVFMRRYERKSVDSKRDADELAGINERLKVLGDLYPKLVALDNKIGDSNGDVVPESELSLTMEINGLIRKAGFPIPFISSGSWISLPAEGLYPATGWPVTKKTTGVDLRNAVISLESKMQQLSTDNQFKSTRASTSIQATAGALEALKSLNDKFHNSLLRILGA